MRVVKPSRILQFAREFPDASAPLRGWLRVTKAADWSDLSDVRRDYSHADGVKVASGHIVTVFNIGGRKYRLIVAINYRWSMVYVLRFLTHAEYNKNKWMEQL